MKRLIPLLALLLAVPAWASWTSSEQPPEADLHTETIYKQTFTTTIGDLAALDISSCAAPLIVDFDGSLADGSTDASAVLFSCTSVADTSNISECRSVPVLDDNNIPIVGDYTGRGISAPGPYLIPRAKTPTTGGDTAQLAVHCTSTGMGPVSSINELSVLDCQAVDTPAGGSCYDETEQITYHCTTISGACIAGAGLIPDNVNDAVVLEGSGSALGLINNTHPQAFRFRTDVSPWVLEATPTTGDTGWQTVSSGLCAATGTLPAGTCESQISLLEANKIGTAYQTQGVIFGSTNTTADLALLTDDFLVAGGDQGGVSTGDARTGTAAAFAGSYGIPLPADEILLDLSCLFAIDNTSAAFSDAGDQIDFCACEQINNTGTCDWWGGLNPAVAADRDKICVHLTAATVTADGTYIIARASSTPVASAKAGARIRMGMAGANGVDTGADERLVPRCNAIVGK